MNIPKLLVLVLVFVVGFTGRVVSQMTNTAGQSAELGIRPSTAASTSATAQDLRLAEQQRKTNLLLETKDWETLTTLKPKVEAQTNFAISDLSKWLQGHLDPQVTNAIVIVPQSGYYLPGQKSSDEVIIDIAEALKKVGVKNVHFHTIAHGLWAEVFAEGLPTREEAIKQKEKVLKSLK